MRKNSIAIISLAFLAACFLTACSTEALESEQPVKGAKIVIPAQKTSTKAVDAEGKATFNTSENVYIYKGSTLDAGVLHPTTNGASTDITGILQESYSVGDEITVLYNTNASGVVDYSGQDGSIESVKDAGMAVNVQLESYHDNVLTTTPATIVNLQSIFKFSFINSSPISGIRSVQISSKDGKLLSSYDVITPSKSTYEAVTVSSSTDLSDVYVALRFDENPEDVISFEVVDKDGNVYQGSKTAPSGGFVNGNFYTASVDVSPIYKTLSALKAAINAEGADISTLKSSYECKYIDSDGNIHDTEETGDVGIIAYLSKEDLAWNPSMSNGNNMTWNSNNISFSGKRLLVIALSGFTAIWNTLSTDGITSSDYNIQRPTDSTPWFVPSRSQMENYIGLKNPRAGAGAIVSLASDYYWSSTHSGSSGKSFDASSNAWANKAKTETHHVQPCFAF